MIRCLLAVSVYLMSISAFACTNALPTDSVGFCSSFRTVAVCYCTSSGVPSGMCQDMQKLYNRMLSYFGSLQAACLYQQDKLHYSSAQDCLDNWNCYLRGGTDSKGRLCSSTQQPCQ